MRNFREIMAEGEREGMQAAAREEQRAAALAIAGYYAERYREKQTSRSLARAFTVAADPRAPAAAGARDRVGRSWDRALAAFAPTGEGNMPRRAVVDRESRMTIRRPGASDRSNPRGDAAIAASWDHALAPHAGVVDLRGR